MQVDIDLFKLSK